MKIFKFGGASVKDADGVQNVGKILNLFPGENIVIVVSAMGKTTNALEIIAKLGYEKKEYKKNLEQLKEYHAQIINALQIHINTDYFIDLILQNTEGNRNFSFAQYYDQIVSIGELISSTILSNYLQAINIKNVWQDARNLIETDNSWMEGIVNWKKTCTDINKIINPLLKINHVITQGFIGKTPDGYSTTLGREGSDYTGAILANCLDADGLWIWKDVPGVLNADPKQFNNTKQIQELTYYEAVEMTYYGAQVIHPKTIKPLQNKQIPLYVKSFIAPEAAGTIIHADEKEIDYPPVLVWKKEQMLMSISTIDFSFIAEKNLSHIYNLFAQHNLKMNMIQTAALSITICTDNIPTKIHALRKKLLKEYKVLINEDLELLTIRHYTAEIMNELTEGKNILLIQRSRNTIQYLMKPEIK